MKIVYEIDVTKEQHDAIESLRNQVFPDHQANRSYYKQLPHMRALQYENNILVGYLGPNSTAKCDTLQYQATNAISLKTIAGCLKSKHFFGR